MGIKCGIVGLPNVGKSTLFNALTANEIPAENYPFCTIDPNVGVVPVPDPRLDRIAEIVKPAKVIPTTMEFVDIAGLVSGASKGEGLGNQFLAHIRETDAIAMVARCFEDDDITHVAGRVDPVSDIETLHTELVLADMETVDKNLDRSRRAAKSGDKALQQRVSLLEKVKAHLDAGHALRTLELADEQWLEIRDLHLLTAKPLMYLANVDESDADENPHLASVRRRAEEEGAEVVPVCAALEAEIAQLDAGDQQAFLEDAGMAEPGLHRVIRAGYRLLGLLTFFTAGEKEARAWTVRQGASAPEAAGVIHTDFQKGFIRAEVVAYEDFIACGGEQGAKDVGKWRLEGKEYRVAEGDIIHFRFNV